MWPRVTEVSLGLWLILSPFIFGTGVENKFLLYSNLLTGTLIGCFSLCSYVHKLRRMHILNGFIALWLILYPALSMPSPPPGEYQNLVVVGILLAMFAILPTPSNKMPLKWEKFYENLPG